MKLTLKEYLTAVRDERNGAAELLIAGFPWKLIMSRAERSASKGYTNYGVSPTWSWITPKGLAKLEELEKEEA